MQKSYYPQKVLASIKGYLLHKQKQLVKRQAELNEEDPFTHEDRLLDNAAVDAEAAEQFGHANVAAMRGEVSRTLVRIKKSLAAIKIGTYGVCPGCGKMIDTDRLVINPTAQYCVTCEQLRTKSD